MQDVTRHLEVREREFAVLDIPASRPRRRRRRVGGASRRARRVEEARGRVLRDLRRHGRRRRHALLRRSPPAPDLLVVGVRDGLVVVRDAPLDPVNLAVAKSGRPAGACRRPGRRERSTRSTRARPADELTVLAAAAGGAAPGRSGGAAGQRVGQRRVRGPARSRHLRVHDARADVRARRDEPRGRRSTSRRTAAWSCRPDASSGSPRTTPIRAWTRPAGAGRNNLDAYGLITALPGQPRRTS